jgi:hypothetical protein
MLPPFEKHLDTALSHYKIQLPLYGRLIVKMLEGTKYEGIKFFGCVIVHLLAEGKYVEYRVENDFINTIMTMNPVERIDEVMAYKNKQISREAKRKELLNG